MHISNYAIIPLFIVSFVLLAFQYYRINPDRRLFNLRFGMMFGAFVLIICTATVKVSPLLSQIFLGLALLWLGSTLYMLRFMPPPRT